jgi:hypothetical protein
MTSKDPIADTQTLVRAAIENAMYAADFSDVREYIDVMNAGIGLLDEIEGSGAKSGGVKTTKIDVPREFVDFLLGSANLRIGFAADAVRYDVTCDDALAGRERDDELFAPIRAALTARECFLRAYDTGEPVPRGVVEDHAEDAIGLLRSDLHNGANSANDIGAEQLAETARVLRDLTAWLDEHELTPVAAVTA